MANDDFKWFGEGFDGFPKFLPEDCVEYTLYIIDSKLNDFDVREKLREVQSEANKLIKKLLKEFIWQREKFALELVRKDGQTRSFLQGRTNYGDSVEDEWLIVYILQVLSRNFAQLWIRIVDTDGQFLLIEAANAIPRWLNPENAEFRIWINNGKLMIIPATYILEENSTNQPAETSQVMTLERALDFLQNSQSKLLHLPSTEAEAFYRLQKYPKQIAESLHHALVTIPRKLAYILHDKAAYISPAIETFYLRDPISTCPLYASDPAKCFFSSTDLVTVSVTFTKVGYAQIKSQQFAVPPAWSHIISTNCDAKSRSRAELGMKITCGFEMLMSDPQNKDLKVVREIKLLLEDIETGEDYLPSDSELSRWKTDDDDEAWLDINFEQFDKELAGKSPKNLPVTSGGFGDKTAQENLRKMVARFEDFLNDDTAGAEGAEYLDDMDKDNDDYNDSSSSGSDTEGNDGEITFNEDEFATLMKEMMGVPNDKTTETRPDYNPEEEDGDDEGGKIRQVMDDMKSELQYAGALRLDRASAADKITHRSESDVARTKGLDGPSRVADEHNDTENEDLDIDYNLAKNLLESFKGQGGGAGPSGNLLGLMGIHMPPDEEENFTNRRKT